MNTWLLLVILSLATFRLTRLVVEDDLPPLLWLRVKIATMRPTKIVTPARGEPHADYWWLGQLITCPWCASAYVSAGLVGATWGLGYSLPVPIFFWLAVWALGALVCHFTE